MHEREKLLKNLKIKERIYETEVFFSQTIHSIVLNENNYVAIQPQIMLERSRANKVSIKEPAPSRKFEDSKQLKKRPSIFITDTIKKMHSAVELNKIMLEKSQYASLVLMNIPTLPEVSGTADYNCKYNN